MQQARVVHCTHWAAVRSGYEEWRPVCCPHHLTSHTTQTKTNCQFQYKLSWAGRAQLGKPEALIKISMKYDYMGISFKLWQSYHFVGLGLVWLVLQWFGRFGFGLVGFSLIWFGWFGYVWLGQLVGTKSCG